MTERSFQKREVVFTCPKTGGQIRSFLNLSWLQQGKEITLGCMHSSQTPPLPVEPGKITITVSPVTENLIFVRPRIDESGIVEAKFDCQECGIIYHCLFEE
ncbi:hypothetical protein HYT02_02230 [Candidatus Gottesmanbacteria bacterium]|nr:hypothetical protein [Candidatus Gottesmanbacteria bacterium]